MIFLRTGLPGASKTLNSLFEICRDHQSDRPKYYTNIKLLMLDYEVASSFSGWFYGWYFPRLKNAKAKKRLVKIMKRIHEEDEFLTLQDAPWLESLFEQHDHFDTWLYWVRQCYSPKSRKDFEEFIENCRGTDAYNFESVQQFNLHFNHFPDATTWNELPKTSIILMDEAQQYFPPRGLNARKPEYIAAFETHRHKGYDIHIITQDPKLIDVNIRRLVGRHVHYYNPTGGERVTRYELPKAFDPEQWHDKQAAQKSLIKREKAFYGVYWSAEIHTHKFKVPRFVFYFAAILVFLAWTGYSLSNTLFGGSDSPAAPVETQKIEQGIEPTLQITTDPEPETALAGHFKTILQDVHIDGSVVQRNDGQTIYHYTFSNTATGEVFYPDNLGLFIKPVNRCSAYVQLGDVQHIITCDPFYKREPQTDTESLYNSEYELASN
ncbi:TPA: zonular occludens toxin [Vibrio harveyi]|nr:zonular occludens toxin [Vibrio harveyi]